MLTTDINNYILKLFFINIILYFMFFKIINYKNITISKIILGVVLSSVVTIIYISIINYIPSIATILTSYLVYSCALAFITKNRLDNSIIAVFISFGISYIFLTISVIAGGVVLKLLIPDINIDNPLNFVFAGFIDLLLFYSFFKIKRFKNGFAFLKDNNKLGKIGIRGVFYSGIIIIICSVLSASNSELFNTYLLAGTIIIGATIIVWIRRKITTYYKQKIKDRIIEELEISINEKNKIIEKISEENVNLATINHKYSSRISALELGVKKLSYETAPEYVVMLDQIKSISKEYSNEVMEKIKKNKSLPTTNIFGIDNIFEYMLTEATNNNIEFNLKINGNINYMVNNIIDQGKLETLIGDHIKNAIIAINSNDSTNRRIMAILGVINDSYELCIYDSGIEFEIDTIVNLGLRHTTTHAGSGGTGIGFMTTFEVLRECKASLIIEEKEPSDNDYTKAVIIRFDGKSEYKICPTYRVEEIKNSDKNGRIILEEHK